MRTPIPTSGADSTPARAIEFTVVPSSLGPLLVAASERGVCQIRFADGDVDPAEELGREFPFADLRENPARLEPWSDALVRYVDGHSDHLDVPLDVRGSRFERRVWAALRRIPRGETRTYAEVADSLGVAKGARAVGRACASNPVAVAIPCHRVVASSGELGGYRWGLARKRALLEREAKEAGIGVLGAAADRSAAPPASSHGG